MKAINSEKKFETEHFKVKIGTLNKKQPTTMYLEAGTYITANDEKESYKSDIIAVEKEMKLLAKDSFRTLNAIQPEFLLVTDVAIGRINQEKGTHYTIQLHFMPAKYQLECKKTFKQLYKEYMDQYGQTFPMYYDILVKHGFSCSKTK